MQYFLNINNNPNQYRSPVNLPYHQLTSCSPRHINNQPTIRTQLSSPDSSKAKIKLVSPNRNTVPLFYYTQNPINGNVFQQIHREASTHEKYFQHQASKQNITLGGKRSQKSPVRIRYENEPQNNISMRPMNQSPPNRLSIPCHQIQVSSRPVEMRHINAHKIQFSHPMSPTKLSPHKIFFNKPQAQQYNQSSPNVSIQINSSRSQNMQVQQDIRFPIHQRVNSNFCPKGPIQYRLIQRIPPKQIFIHKKKPQFINKTISSGQLNIQQPNQIAVLRHSYENQMKQIKSLQEQIAQNNQQIKQLLKLSKSMKKQKQPEKSQKVQQLDKIVCQNVVIVRQEVVQPPPKIQKSLQNSLKQSKGQQSIIHQLNFTTNKLESKSFIPKQHIQNTIKQIKTQQKINSKQQIQKQKLVLIKNNQCQLNVHLKHQKEQALNIPQQSIIFPQLNHEIYCKQVQKKGQSTQSVIDHQIATYLDEKIGVAHAIINDCQIQQLKQKQSLPKTSKKIIILHNSSKQLQKVQCVKQSQKPQKSSKTCKIFSKENQNLCKFTSQNNLSQKDKKTQTSGQGKEPTKIDDKASCTIKAETSSKKSIKQGLNQNQTTQALAQPNVISIKSIKKLSSSPIILEEHEIQNQIVLKPSIQIQKQQISFNSKHQIPQPDCLQNQQIPSKKQMINNSIQISRMTEKIHNAFKKNSEKKIQQIKNKPCEPVIKLQDAVSNHDKQNKYNFSESQIKFNSFHNLVKHKYQTATMPNFYSSNVCSVLQSPYKILNQNTQKKAQTVGLPSKNKRISNRAYL